MIPFYPVGEDRRNGNGLPMVHCLAQQGLKDADDPVFAEEATAGKKSVSLMLSVRCLSFVVSRDSNIVHPHSGQVTIPNLTG